MRSEAASSHLYGILIHSTYQDTPGQKGMRLV